MSEHKPAIIDKETLIPISLIVTLIAAAMTFGIMYQKVEQAREDIAGLKGQLTMLNEKVDRLLLKSIAIKE